MNTPKLPPHIDDEGRAVRGEMADALASAPPAPQADNWRKYATEREDSAQAVIERHRKEHESLLRLLAKDRRTIADLKAGVVQQEPVAVIDRVAGSGPNDVCIEWRGGIACIGTKLYIHPAQQAKPQPLSDVPCTCGGYQDGWHSRSCQKRCE